MLSPGTRARALAAVPYLVFLGLALPWLAAVPIWDGMYYYDCVLRATQPPYPLSAFSCADHPPGYLMLAGWPQYLLPGSVVALNLANLAWMCVGIAGLAQLVETLAGEAASALEKALVVTVFASAPLVVAVTYHFAADQGLLVFYPWVLDALLRGRPAQAFVAGVGLTFSKEPGLGLYGIAWLALVLPGARELLAPERRRAWLRKAALLLLPVVPAGLYLAWRLLAGMGLFNREAEFAPGEGGGMAAGWAIILLLNFSWLLWGGPLLAWALRWLQPARRAALVPAPVELQLALVLLLVGLALARTAPYQNPRYFVTTLVLLLPLAHGLLRRALPPGARAAFLLLLVGLQLAANRATLDPVSVAAFGSVNYGRMKLHCRYWDLEEKGCWGRDQLVYNQQFLEVQAAQDVLFRELRPAPGTTFVVGRYANYLMHGALDAQSFRRRLAGGPVVEPRFVTAEELAGDERDPETLYVLEYPRLGATGLPELKRRYRVVREAAYGTRRFRIRVTELRRKDPR